MAFILSDLVVESVLRDGIEDARRSLETDADQVLDVFGELLAPHLERHYGERELNKIRELIRSPLRLVHGFSLDDVKVPQISVNLLSDVELEGKAGMDDFSDEQDTDKDPVVLVGTFNADSYDSLTGIVVVNTADPDLSGIRVGNVFVDGSGVEFPIVGAITDLVSEKRFAIAKAQTPNLTGGQIVSVLAQKRHNKRSTRDDEAILITCISEEPLVTKYLYTLIKYFILSRKSDLLARGLDLVTFDGSDFTRQDHLPANVFARTLTLKAHYVEHSWDAGTVVLLDTINPAINVKRDLLPREDEQDFNVKTVVE